jgi:hypothetical protein
LPNETSCSKTSRRFTCGMPPCCFAGGTFSVALSVSESADTGQSLCHPNRSPGVTRRVALHPESARSELRITLMTQDGVRTFLPSDHLAIVGPAITRPARQLYCIANSKWFDCDRLLIVAKCVKASLQSSGQRALASFSNSDSVKMGTPSSLALSYFEPGSVPTMT